MAPYGSTRRRRRRTRSTTRKTRSTQFKKKQENSEDQEISNALPPDDSSLSKKIDEGDKILDNSVEISNNGCSTPKGKKFRIPRINTCPPAPMKRRSSSSSSLVSSNCSLRRTPIAFFAPPDLELFFFFASDHLCVNDGVGSSF